jgi:hypothetical protein
MGPALFRDGSHALFSDDNIGGGREFVAAQDLPPGTLLLSEEPFVPVNSPRSAGAAHLQANQAAKAGRVGGGGGGGGDAGDASVAVVRAILLARLARRPRQGGGREKGRDAGRDEAAGGESKTKKCSQQQQPKQQQEQQEQQAQQQQGQAKEEEGKHPDEYPGVMEGLALLHPQTLQEVDDANLIGRIRER